MRDSSSDLGIPRIARQPSRNCTRGRGRFMRLLATGSVAGTVSFAVTAAHLEPLGVTYNQTTHVATIVVANTNGDLEGQPVSFVDTSLGYADIGTATISNGQARLSVADYPLGSHYLQAWYPRPPGESGAPYISFTINVRELGWLPPVLDELSR